MCLVQCVAVVVLLKTNNTPAGIFCSPVNATSMTSKEMSRIGKAELALGKMLGIVVGSDTQKLLGQPVYVALYLELNFK